MPDVGGLRIRASDIDSGSGGDIREVGLALSTRVISTADSNVLRKLVLGLNSTDTSHAQSAVAIASELKLALGIAVDTSNGLTSVSLSLGPLSLLVTRGAGV